MIAADLELAADYDASRVAPVLEQGQFIDCSTGAAPRAHSTGPA